MANRIGNSGSRDSEGVSRSSGDRSDDSAIGRENIRGVGDGADDEEEYDVEEFEDTDDLDEDTEEEDETI